MKFEMKLVFCVLVVLTGSSQTRGLSSAAMPPGTSTSPDPTEDPDHEVPQWTHNPAGRDETTTETTVTGTGGHPETVTNAAYKTLTSSSTGTTSEHTHVPVLTTDQPATASPSAPTDSLSSTPVVQSSTPLQHLSTTEGRALLTTDPLTTFSSPPAHTVQYMSSTAHASTIQEKSESLTSASTQPATTGLPLTSAPGRGPAGPTHQEVPSELNVGDEDHKRPRSSSPLDPLLAGLLSVFIVTTAVVFVVLFLKFRQRTNHPEFHRLQDLPMDDLMEDTPLSRYSY